VYCKGRVDGIIPEVLRIAVERLDKAELEPFKVLLLEIFANCLFYNPAMTLAYIESKGWTSKLFSLWFQLLNEHFTRLHDIKLSILAFTSLLKVPFMSWPTSLQGELKNLISAITELIFKYTKEKQIKEEKIAKIKEAAGESEGDGTGDDDEDDDEEEEGDQPPEQPQQLINFDNDDDDDAITKEAEELLKNFDETKSKRVYEDDEDAIPSGNFGDRLFTAYCDDDDDDFDLEDDDEFEVKTDQIDEVLFFCKNFSEFSKRDVHVYDALVKVLTDLEKEKLSQLVLEANKRVVNNQQKSQ